MIRRILFSVLAIAFAFAQEVAPPVPPAPLAPPVVATGAAPVITTEKPGSNLSIFPTRLVLEGRSRSEEIVLRNSGKAAATYRILFKEMEMNENGEIQERPRKEGEITAADLIRFSPRQVELAPGETQTVRIQVRKPEGLVDGEYRSHLLFQAVPVAEPPAPLGGEVERALSVKITTLLGMSIPIILRHGETQGKLAISELRFWRPGPKVTPGAPPVLSLRMTREGNRSLSGAFTAVVESGGKLKKGTLLWELPVVPIYTSMPWRNVHMPMYQGKNGELNGARVKITCTPVDFKGAPIVAYLDIPA